MKLADVQILFYAIDPTSDRHAIAGRWLEDAINDPEPVGVAWPTLQQFLRLGTNAAFPGCMSDREAIGWVSEWLAAGVEIVDDGDLRWEIFAELVAASGRTLRNSVDDAWLAALAISRGATLASFDRDFEPFVGHGLRWQVPGA